LLRDHPLPLWDGENRAIHDRVMRTHVFRLDTNAR
jgi:hypothetical protein